jgi:glycosyltransferase involved in cell wall biosynthesis
MADHGSHLRLALLAGTLSQGGAEKQLLYMTRALQGVGIEVRIYSLTKGEFYEGPLQAIGTTPYWVGQRQHPLSRLARMTRVLRDFRPQIVQAAHFYVNLYATLLGKFCNAITIGSLRNDLISEVKGTGVWGQWLLRMPPALLCNSYAARRNAEAFAIRAGRIHVLPNVIDISDFDSQTLSAEPPLGSNSQLIAMAVGRLVPEKRFDRFLFALARARSHVPELKGVIVGDGPERPRLEGQANALGLLPDRVSFLGRRNEVPRLMRAADLCVLCSDHEGFPNVILEAMAARRPVVTTPAGDAGVVVQEGETGFVVPFNEVEALAERMTRLARSPDLRQKLGEAGRHRVEQQYGSEGLAARLLSIYHDIAEQHQHRGVLSHLRC